MIELIIKSPQDSDISGNYFSFADKISIGRGQSADLIIQDSSILALHLHLEVLKDQLRVTPHESKPFWHNGKKSIGPKNLKIGDQLRLGNTEITMTNFALTPFNRPPKEDLESRFINAVKSSPIKRELLEALRQELNSIDTRGHDV